jgi:hypothetical protein
MIKLSNGVEISEDTVVNALRKAGIRTEPIPPKTEADNYPIATVYRDRLILNLPDKYLSSEYKGHVFSVADDGLEGQKRKKTSPVQQQVYKGHWYSAEKEKQVFPAI